MRFNLDQQHKQAREYLEKLIEKGVRVDITEKKGRRSLDQNALYWLWLTCVSEETGYTKEDLHLMYRAKYLQRDETYITKIIYTELWEKVKIRINQFEIFKGLDEIINIISYSTTEIDTKQFTDYMESIRDHAAQTWGVRLLTMDEEQFEYFYEQYK